MSGIAEREEEIVVTRNGNPAAVLVNYDQYERLKDSLEVLSDPELMKQIRRSKSFCAKGRQGMSFEAVFGEPLRARKTAEAVMAVYRPDIPPHVPQLIRPCRRN